MANDEHLKILKQGVDTWNKWREENPKIRPDLERSDLSKAYLSEANLSEANLSEAYLSWVRLGHADLSNADLSRADLIGVTLSEATLSSADLSEATLSEANLRGANLSRTRLRGAYLVEANLRGANLRRTCLRGALLLGTNIEEANISNSLIYGISAWNLKGKPKEQLNLIITPPDEPTITVDDLEVAQFVYLLLKHEKLRNVINSVTERGVLILGRFGDGGLEVLQSIAAKLREMRYLPIIFDFDRPADRDYTETVKTLVGLSRFVIVDLSGPSVPQELYATVPFFDIPFVPIVEKGRKKYSMFKDLLKYDWVLKPPVKFASEKQLIELIPSKIVAPAEKKHKKRQKQLEKIFKR